MRKGRPSKRNSKAWAISDRSGMKFRMSEMVVEPGTGYLVHRSESDGMWNAVDHPQAHLDKWADLSGDPFPVENARPDRNWHQPITYTAQANIGANLSVFSTAGIGRQGIASLSGSASVTALGILPRFGTASISGSSSVSSAALRAARGTSSISGSSSVSASATTNYTVLESFEVSPPAYSVGIVDTPKVAGTTFNIRASGSSGSSLTRTSSNVIEGSFSYRGQASGSNNQFRVDVYLGRISPVSDWIDLSAYSKIKCNAYVASGAGSSFLIQMRVEDSDGSSANAQTTSLTTGAFDLEIDFSSFPSINKTQCQVSFTFFCNNGSGTASIDGYVDNFRGIT